MKISESSTTILRLMSTPGIGVVKTNEVIRAAKKANIPVQDFVAKFDHVTRVLNREQLSRFEVTSTDWTFPDEYCGQPLQLVNATEDHYPESLSSRLQKFAPPLLVCIGNLDLLTRPGVGFCGSRSVSDIGIGVADSIAMGLCKAQYNLVSGYAAGVDLAIHEAALKYGSTTTIVLAEGISHFRVKKQLQSYWDWEKVLVVSEFLPANRWSVSNAMQRNHTICGLAETLVVVEAGETGGSLAAGRFGMKVGLPVIAPVYDSIPTSAKGNSILADEGALSPFVNQYDHEAIASQVDFVIEKYGEHLAERSMRQQLALL